MGFVDPSLAKFELDILRKYMDNHFGFCNYVCFTTIYESITKVKCYCY